MSSGGKRKTKRSKIDEKFLCSLHDWVWEMDALGYHTYSNSAVEKILGYSIEEVVGYHITKLWYLEDCEKGVVLEVQDWLSKGIGWTNYIGRFQHKNGSIKITESTGIPYFDSAGKLLGYRGIDRDITKRKYEHENFIYASRKIENLHNVARKMAACNDFNELYRLIVDAARRILDLTLCYLGMREGSKLITKASTPDFLPGEETCIDAEEGLAGKTLRTGTTYIYGSRQEMPFARQVHLQIESVISSPLGEFGVFQALSYEKDAFTDEDARLLELLLGHAEVTMHRIKLQMELKEMAVHDPLTGVYNRYYLTHMLQCNMKRSRRSQKPLAFLMVDIDRFKEINDRFGHQCGDAVLTKVAQILMAALRESDIVIRYGGDEFLVILPDTGEDFQHAIDRILELLKTAKMDLPEVDFPITVSIGGASWSSEADETMEHILNIADQRMYDEKKRKTRIKN